MRYLKSSEEFINESFFGKVKDFFSKDKEFDKTPEEKYKELVGLIIDFVYDKESEFYLSIKYQKHNHNYELEVQGKNLQDFLYKNYADRLDKLDLIKIDAEGYDKEILKTIPKILETYKPNLMIECYKKLTPEERDELFNIATGYGYTLYYLENFEEGGLKVEISKDQMNDKKHFEMLAIHNDRM